MVSEITIGALLLQFEMRKCSLPLSGKLKDLVLVSAAVRTPYSETKVERLGIPFPELVAFRQRLRKFLRQEDEGVVSLGVLMPSLDITLISRTGGRVMVDVRLSPDLRAERHMYDLELTWNEVVQIGRDFDLLVVSLPLNEEFS